MELKQNFKLRSFRPKKFFSQRRYPSN